MYMMRFMGGFVCEIGGHYDKDRRDLSQKVCAPQLSAIVLGPEHFFQRKLCSNTGSVVQVQGSRLLISRLLIDCRPSHPLGLLSVYKKIGADQC